MADHSDIVNLIINKLDERPRYSIVPFQLIGYNYVPEVDDSMSYVYNFELHLNTEKSVLVYNTLFKCYLDYSSKESTAASYVRMVEFFETVLTDGFDTIDNRFDEDELFMLVFKDKRFHGGDRSKSEDDELYLSQFHNRIDQIIRLHKSGFMYL